METKERSPAPRGTWGRRALFAAGAALFLAGTAVPAAAFYEAPWPHATYHQSFPAWHHHHGLSASYRTYVDGEMAEADLRTMPDAQAYCADRFKSYDPSSGTYLGYDGREHACP